MLKKWRCDLERRRVQLEAVEARRSVLEKAAVGLCMLVLAWAARSLLKIVVYAFCWTMSLRVGLVACFQARKAKSERKPRHALVDATGPKLPAVAGRQADRQTEAKESEASPIVGRKLRNTRGARCSLLWKRVVVGKGRSTGRKPTLALKCGINHRCKTEPKAAEDAVS